MLYIAIMFFVIATIRQASGLYWYFWSKIMVKYRLLVSTKHSRQIVAFDGESVNQCYNVAQSCYGKNVICEIVCLQSGESVKKWTKRK